MGIEREFGTECVENGRGKFFRILNQIGGEDVVVKYMPSTEGWSQSNIAVCSVIADVQQMQISL